MGLHEDCYPLTKEAYLKFQVEIDAWARGEEIQYSMGNGEWFDIKEGETPQWITAFEYRVKPQDNFDRARTLLYSTLNLDIDDIPRGGVSISLDDMFFALKFIERTLRLNLNKPYEFNEVIMVTRPEITTE